MINRFQTLLSTSTCATTPWSDTWSISLTGSVTLDVNNGQFFMEGAATASIDDGGCFDLAASLKANLDLPAGDSRIIVRDIIASIQVFCEGDLVNLTSDSNMNSNDDDYDGSHNKVEAYVTAEVKLGVKYISVSDDITIEDVMVGRCRLTLL